MKWQLGIEKLVASNRAKLLRNSVGAVDSIAYTIRGFHRNRSAPIIKSARARYRAAKAELGSSYRHHGVAAYRVGGKSRPNIESLASAWHPSYRNIIAAISGQ